MSVQLAPKFENYKTSIIENGPDVGALEVDIEEVSVPLNPGGIDTRIRYFVTGALNFRTAVVDESGQIQGSESNFEVAISRGHSADVSRIDNTVSTKVILKPPKQKIDPGKSVVYARYWDLKLRDLTNKISVDLDEVEFTFNSTTQNEVVNEVEEVKKVGETKKVELLAGAPATPPALTSTPPVSIPIPAPVPISIPTPVPVQRPAPANIIPPANIVPPSLPHVAPRVASRLLQRQNALIRPPVKIAGPTNPIIPPELAGNRNSSIRNRVAYRPTARQAAINTRRIATQAIAAPPPPAQITAPIPAPIPAVSASLVPAQTLAPAQVSTPVQAPVTQSPVSNDNDTMTIDVPDADKINRLVLNLPKLSKIEEVAFNFKK